MLYSQLCQDYGYEDRFTASQPRSRLRAGRQARNMEPHGQSPWPPTSRPCGATSRSHDCTFLHGQRPWSPAAGMKIPPTPF
jgi:hypothetical protein